ncbi:hypothetical protein [Polaromonas sp. LjRoot131]|jgi:hypothetical protein|uniref:hypothetical protein n=1 Tax=Polaromonas sp. LjRoot131 TaxID=3342262 RepID=UPI003ED0A9F0
MDSDLLHVLCALAAFGVPLALAWWIAGRDEKPASTPAVEGETDGSQERPRCYPLRSDL